MTHRNADFLEVRTASCHARGVRRQGGCALEKLTSAQGLIAQIQTAASVQGLIAQIQPAASLALVVYLALKATCGRLFKTTRSRAGEASRNRFSVTITPRAPLA